jgi:hypothetical protein
VDRLGIAEKVVIRHLCHCETATEEPGPNDAVEHKFTVDGEDFPWYITARGPQATRLAKDLYAVDVEIMGICKDRNDQGYHEVLGIEYERRAGMPYRPVIGGVPFPYTCSDDVMTLQFSSRMIPTLHLKFLARDVDAKGIEIEDRRSDWDGKALYRAGGDRIRDGQVHCYKCDQWVDDLFEHSREQHGLKNGEGVTVSST